MKRFKCLNHSLSFAKDKLQKSIEALKSMQEKAIISLNDYCRNNITISAYCQFIKSYNNVLLAYEYWANEVNWISYCINEVRKCRT